MATARDATVPLEPQPREARREPAAAETIRGEPANHNAQPSSRARLLAASAALALATFAVYAGRLSGPFVFDDEQAITANATLRDLGSFEVLSPPRETPVAARPLVNLTFALNRALFGLSPASFHAVNLALHALAVLLVFACLRRLLAAPSLPAAVRGQALSLAWIAALLFAVHPIASEVVLYASQRTEGLVAVAYLAAVYLLIRAAEGGGPVSLWPAAVVGLLGAASKEVFVTAPLALLFLDRAFYAGSFSRALQLRARLYLGLASSVLVLGALQLGDPRPDSVRFGELAYLLAQGKIVAGYFATAFWPSSLAVDHGPLPAAVDVARLAPLAALLALAVLAGAALAFRRPKLGYLAVWVFGILAPSSSLFSVHTEVGADRRFYLPLIAVIAYAVVGFGAVLARLPSSARRPLAIGSIAAAVIALSAATRSHAETYASTRAVWQQVVRVHPHNPRGHYNLAETYRREGELLGAAQSFRAALERDPHYVDAHVNLGSTLVVLGQTGEALAHLHRAVALAPNDAKARYNLGIALALSGQLRAALPELEEVVRLQPSHLEARRKLAHVYFALGRRGEARAQAERILQLQPGDAVAERVLRAASAL